MNKRIIVVIFGGKSSEYEVSLSSAYAVLTHMDQEKYEIMTIGITRQGKWLLYEGDYAAIKNDTWKNYAYEQVVLSPESKAIHMLKDNEVTTKIVDAIFPVLHGKNGEDGTIQGICQIANIPVIGCGILSSALCMDKDRAHRMVSTIGVTVPKAVVLTHQTVKKQELLEIQLLSYPLFIKPMRAGSSFGITKIYNEKELLPAIYNAFTYDDTVIVEENIDGFEVGCAVIGNQELQVGEVDEIELTQGFFDFTEKYTLQSSKIHLPARISKEMKSKVQETAKKIYQILDCSVFARVDMFITPSGEIVFNEINTIPGFTAHSRFPSMMKGIGMTFSQIIEKVIEEGLQDENVTTI